MIGAVRGAAPVAAAVGRRDAHRHGRQPALARVLHHQVLGLHPRPHVRRERLGLRVGDHVVLRRRAAPLAADGDVAAGEDEALEARGDLGLDGDLEHVSRALDIGAEQRRRITQPAPGVDDAVVDDVAAGHRLAQYVVVPDVAEEPGDLQIVDADRGGPRAHHHPDVLPVGDELARHVRAEVAVRADDERGAGCGHTTPPTWRIQLLRLVGQGAEFLGLLAPLHRRGDEPQRVVDVLLATPEPVAGVGDDRDVGGADDDAVAGIAHRIVELAQHASGGLVVHLPQRRERRHVAAGEGLHRLPDPGPHLFAAAHRARGVLDVEDVVGVLLDPGIPVAGLGGPAHRLPRIRRMRRPARRG